MSKKIKKIKKNLVPVVVQNKDLTKNFITVIEYEESFAGALIEYEESFAGALDEENSIMGMI